MVDTVSTLIGPTQTDTPGEDPPTFEPSTGVLPDSPNGVNDTSEPKADNLFGMSGSMWQNLATLVLVSFLHGYSVEMQCY